ncbi:hypothetical protein EDD11_009168 [Mortierella claussenii]|nr:hypothetical protein EDD11_009168 [Mortierella claussenii]
MSAEALDPPTLTLDDAIEDLPEDGEQTGSLQDERHFVTLASVSDLTSDIILKEQKMVVGRCADKCSDGAVIDLPTVSSTHFEISTDSPTEYDDPIWIKDVSRNGVWINQKKIEPQTPTKLSNGDMIAFHGEKPRAVARLGFMVVDKRKAKVKRGNKELAEEAAGVATSEGPDNKKQKLGPDDGDGNGDNASHQAHQGQNTSGKVENESVFEKEFGCNICLEIMHKPLVLQPCLHAFCKACCNGWFQDSNVCPACRQRVHRTKKDFRLNNLIEAFIEKRPDLKRDNVEDDGAASDSSDIMAANRHRRGNIRHNNHGEEYGDDDEYDYDDEDGEEDEDDGEDEVNRVPRGYGLPPNCPCCDINNTLGYTCPDGVRLGRLPAYATWADYFARRRIQPGHTQCVHCQKHLPILPAHVDDAVHDQFRCKMCHISSCGCRLQSVEDMIETAPRITGFLNNYEENVIMDYLESEYLTLRDLWEAIKDGLDDEIFQYLPPNQPNPRVLNAQIGSEDKICQDYKVAEFD